MSIKPIEDFKKLPRATKVTDLLKQIGSRKINSAAFNNQLHLACNIMKRESRNDNLEVMQSFIDFDIVFKHFSEYNDTYEPFTQMLCGKYNENYTIEESRCFDTMNKYMQQGKTIYIFVIFNSYIIDVDPKTELQDSLTHTTGLLLHPSKSGKYSAFHFNPHGQAGIDVKQYEIYISRWRKKTIGITQSLDIWMITEMINGFNKYSETHMEHIPIEYKPTKHYNYVGPCLQAGDKFGVCYVFPFYMFYELCCNMNNITYLHDDTITRRFPSYSTLLERGDTHTAIFIMLSKLFKDVRKLFFNYCFKRARHNIVHSTEVTESQYDLNTEIEEAIEKQGSRYVKIIVSASLKYVTQPALQEKIVSVL
jgi:hypothetical protein